MEISVKIPKHLQMLFQVLNEKQIVTSYMERESLFLSPPESL